MGELSPYHVVAYIGVLVEQVNYPNPNLPWFGLSLSINPNLAFNRLCARYQVVLALTLYYGCEFGDGERRG